MIVLEVKTNVEIQFLLFPALKGRWW